MTREWKRYDRGDGYEYELSENGCFKARIRKESALWVTTYADGAKEMRLTLKSAKRLAEER